MLLSTGKQSVLYKQVSLCCHYFFIFVCNGNAEPNSETEQGNALVIHQQSLIIDDDDVEERTADSDES